ncbi:recombination protein NinB [Novosphingobium sp. ZW T3_23]|uniref:recombination protein NinB n=1 Tax=Novosphingobium sp. ZW T3_23 TaxID=3378084 RepID=UPI003852065B
MAKQGGQTITLANPSVRALAHRLIDAAPAGAVVNIKEAARTSDQNAKLWAMLSDIARAKPQGRVLTTEVWKALFMNAAGFTCAFEPTLDGQGVIPLGFKSSRLNKAEFSDLLEAIHCFAAEHGIQFTDPIERKAA